MSKRAFVAHVLSFLLGIVRWAALAYVAKVTYDAILVMAANRGQAHPILQLVASTNRVRSFAFLLGILGVLYGILQAELRKRSEANLRAALAERTASTGL